MAEGPLQKIRTFFRKAWKVVVQVNQDKATDMLEFEVKEMENIFVILLMGSFIGLPSPPLAMVLELLPHMEDEIALMISRADFAQDPLGAVMGMLHVD